MSPDLSFLNLIMNASLVVKCVMLALLVASLVSWTMILLLSQHPRKNHRP